MGNYRNFDRNPSLLGAFDKLRRCGTRFLKSKELGANPITVQADNNMIRFPNQMLQNRQMLAGKVRKTIYVKPVIFRKITVLQLLQNPTHLIPGVTLAPLAQRIVAFQQQ